MIKNSTIVRPSALAGMYDRTMFIPLNSNDHLIQIDMGFDYNPIYKQDKLCLFLPQNIYYQKLVLNDGKANAINDNARVMVITGEIEENNPITFQLDIQGILPLNTKINTEFIALPFYPELKTDVVIQDSNTENTFYHFGCNKVINKPDRLPYIQLRYLMNYHDTNLASVLKGWHTNEVTRLDNIPHRK